LRESKRGYCQKGKKMLICDERIGGENKNASKARIISNLFCEIGGSFGKEKNCAPSRKGGNEYRGISNWVGAKRSQT